MPVRIVGSGSIEGVADYEALSVAHPDAAGTNMVLSADGSVAFDSVPASIQSAIDAVPPGGFDAAVTIIASDAAWPVPTLGNPVVKVTVVGGGGGGGSGYQNNGGNGGTTTFNAGAGKTFSASGGSLGSHGWQNSNGAVGTAGFVSGNSGQGGTHRGGDFSYTGVQGNSGVISVNYVDLTEVSTVAITIGAGGSGGSGSHSTSGGAGGRGEVIVEYKAAA